MNIIIPMGGLGERFKNEGYTKPKPLINIHGKPMLLHVINSLSLNKNDTLILIYNKELDNYNFKSIINTENIQYHILNHQTKGAAETILSLSHDDCIDKTKKTVICDCDTFYTHDILSSFRSMSNNAIMYFEEYTETPIYSYIKINENKIISEIKEKVKISNFANTGCYCFESLATLLQYCSKAVTTNYTFNNEYYISCVIDIMLKEGHVFHPIKIQQKDIHCVGTPNQLKLYSLTNNKCNIPLRFCFDIDHTLVCMTDNYKTGDIIEKNVNFLKYLKKQGHIIILYTARRMKTHGGNEGKVLKDVGKLTLDFLNEHGIPYDEIYFGKPYADFYIDDKAINAYADLEKETGIYQNSVQERSMNNIEYCLMPVIIKKGDPWKIAGEIFYYNHIPENIKNYFPVFIRSEKDNYMLEKIDGINLSFLFVKQQMTLDVFRKTLNSLFEIHNNAPPDDDIDKLKQDVYAHYKKRLESRSKHSIYRTLPNAQKVYSLLERFFEYYEKKDLARITMVHGDPVFSNVLITKDGNIKFIDMRGVLLDEVSVYGDPIYDIAKVLQSLMGYDENMHDTYVNNVYKFKLLSELETCKNVANFDIVKIITYSHIFTLLPLHEYNKAMKYYDLININALEELVLSLCNAA